MDWRALQVYERKLHCVSDFNTSVEDRASSGAHAGVVPAQEREGGGLFPGFFSPRSASRPITSAASLKLPRARCDLPLPAGGFVPKPHCTLLHYFCRSVQPLPEGLRMRSLPLVQVTVAETAFTSRCRRMFTNAHAYHINSISVNSDGQTFISADDLVRPLSHSLVLFYTSTTHSAVARGSNCLTPPAWGAPLSRAASAVAASESLESGGIQHEFQFGGHQTLKHGRPHRGSHPPTPPPHSSLLRCLPLCTPACGWNPPVLRVSYHTLHPGHHGSGVPPLAMQRFRLQQQQRMHQACGHARTRALRPAQQAF